MKMKVAALSLIVLTACQQQSAGTRDVAANDIAAPTQAQAPADNVATSSGDGSNAVATKAKPADRKILEEPQEPIDPKSTEAAGQVVQHYGALVEQARFAEASSAWGDRNNALAFAKELQSRGLKHLEIGDLGNPEGAAGSVYVTMPVIFYQGTRRSPATIILRRVNDVPGSTEAQRRWHIDRIEWSRR